MFDVIKRAGGMRDLNERKEVKSKYNKIIDKIKRGIKKQRVITKRDKRA